MSHQSAEILHKELSIRGVVAVYVLLHAEQIFTILLLVRISRVVAADPLA